jgi:hypothetical protein
MRVKILQILQVMLSKGEIWREEAKKAATGNSI